MQLKLVNNGGVRGINVRISVSRVIYVWVRLVLNTERAYSRLQRLGHSKFRRSFVERESNFVLETADFVHQLSFDPIYRILYPILRCNPVSFRCSFCSRHI